MIGALRTVRRTDHTVTDVSRRTVIRGATASLFALGGVGNAAADEEEESDGGEEPTANVTFSDQTVANNEDGPTVTVDRLKMNKGGYQSIHRYSRFQFADGEDPEEYDVPIPDELDNPICESLIGITKYLPAGDYENLEVPLYRSDSPAVELGAEEVGSLDESQVMIAIPHQNTTDEDTFNCPDGPSTPDPFGSGDEVDGAFQNGGRDVDGIGISHDLATVLVETDDEEQKEIAKREEELIRAGVLVPQPVGPDNEEQEGTEEENEDDEGEQEEEDEDEKEDDESEEVDDETDEDEESEEADDETDEDDSDDDEREDEEDNDEEVGRNAGSEGRPARTEVSPGRGAASTTKR